MSVLRHGAHDDRQCPPAAGFTMVELLVVIGIIAVIVAMLLPALNKAMQAARTLQCQSNLKQIGLAMFGYADAYKGVVVPFEITTHTKPGVDDTYVSNTLWFALLASTGHLRTASKAYWTGTGLQGPNVLYCPEGDINAWSHNNSPFPTITSLPTSHVNAWKWGTFSADHNGVTGDFVATNSNSTKRAYVSWYVANGAHYYSNVGNEPVGSLQNWACRAIPWQIDNSPLIESYDCGVLSRVKAASDHVFVTDGLAIKNGEAFEGIPYTPYAIQARHNGYKKVNVLFYDGHVDALPCAKDGYGPNDVRTFPGGTPASGKPFEKANLKAYQNFYPRWRNDFP